MIGGYGKAVGCFYMTTDGKRDSEAYWAIEMYYKPNRLCRFILAKVFNIYWTDK